MDAFACIERHQAFCPDLCWGKRETRTSRRSRAGRASCSEGCCCFATAARVPYDGCWRLAVSYRNRKTDRIAALSRTPRDANQGMVVVASDWWRVGTALRGARGTGGAAGAQAVRRQVKRQMLLGVPVSYAFVCHSPVSLHQTHSISRTITCDRTIIELPQEGPQLAEGSHHRVSKTSRTLKFYNEAAMRQSLDLLCGELTHRQHTTSRTLRFAVVMFPRRHVIPRGATRRCHRCSMSSRASTFG